MGNSVLRSGVCDTEGLVQTWPNIHDLQHGRMAGVRSCLVEDLRLVLGGVCSLTTCLRGWQCRLLSGSCGTEPAGTRDSWAKAGGSKLCARGSRGLGRPGSC